MIDRQIVHMTETSSTCEECGGAIVPSDRGEAVCLRCGLVAEANMIDFSPVTVQDDSYQGPGGAGHGPALQVQTPVTMSTRPTSVTRDASGKPLSPAAAQRAAYLNTIDSRVISKRDRSSKRLYEVVHDLTLRLGVPEAEERAFYIARKAVETKTLKGWEFTLVAGSSVYYALRERDGYVRMEDFSPMILSSRPAEVPASLLTSYKRIKRMLGSEPRRASALEIAEDVIAALGLPTDTISLVKINLAGMDRTDRPRIDAAAALYVACGTSGIDLNQREIAEACGTTDVSLRTRLGKASNSPDEMVE